jgi:hypothetical protein
LRYLSGNVGENQMIVRECDVKYGPRPDHSRSS